jgi:excisionase family DNA binding protein
MSDRKKDAREVLTTRECAARLGMTPDYLNKLAREKKVRRYKTGRRSCYFIWQEVLENLRKIEDLGHVGDATATATIDPGLERLVASELGKMVMP